MAKVDRLAYGLFEVANLGKWREFLATVYGLELHPVPESSEHEAVVDADGSRLLFREGPAEDLVAVGWLADDLDGLHDQLSTFGAPVSWQDADYAASRGAGRVFMQYFIQMTADRHLLAKMEMRYLYEELFDRVESIELTGEPQVVRSNFVGGLKSLPIRFTVE